MMYDFFHLGCRQLNSFCQLNGAGTGGAGEEWRTGAFVLVVIVIGSGRLLCAAFIDKAAGNEGACGSDEDEQYGQPFLHGRQR